MQIPNNDFDVKVGPFTYRVVYNQSVSDESASWGSIHHHNLRIFINPEIALQRQLQTFLHELIHAICSVSGLRGRFNTDSPPDEEEVAHAISMLLYQVIQDNPTLFEGGKQ